MKTKRLDCLCLLGLALTVGEPGFVIAQELPFTDTFHLEEFTLKDKGVNPYFIPLKPGSELCLMGEDDGEVVTLRITVLNQVRVINGVRCRVVREMEWEGEDLVEISWNYFAFCKEHGGIFYFGEDVDIYEDGEVVSHEGAWRAGENGARAGLIMPGFPLVGSRYYQEVAPGVALDRAEHTSTTAVVTTPAGTFHNCLEVVETSPLGGQSYKVYAPGIGLVQDGSLKLVSHRFPGQHKEKKNDRDNDDDDR